MSGLAITFKHIVKTLAIQEDMPIAVACSGGPDSMALTLLAQERFKNVTALIVDHGLRKGSAHEANQVAAWLKTKHIAAVILRWKGRKPMRNIQEAARDARYRLLSEYCNAHGLTHMLVAHHVEDQAETFLLRLARG